jgi:tetratricopeptide (TPR) repeat protein
VSLRDQQGNALSGATGGALAHYQQGLRLLQCYLGDPLAEAEAAIAAAPSMPMAHALKAWLLLLGTEPGGLAPARRTLRTALRLPANRRESAHLQAIGMLAAGSWHDAARVLEDLSIDHPLDALALQVGHQLDFFTGNARMLRDRIARALPAWDAGMPAYHALLGMHAFGLEEMGDYALAEAQGRRAVELERRDGWAQHAVVHVMEMQGRHEEGIAWMRADPEAWSRDSFFAVHNWWHLALLHLDRGDIDEALALLDGPVDGGRSGVVMDLVDVSLLHWRLHLRGAALGGRWQALADRWQPLAGAGHYAFNDLHAMMAFVGAGRHDAARRLLETQRAAMRVEGDNAEFTRQVGYPAALALKAFGEGDYGSCVRRLRPLRAVAQRFGGSHAQRDLLDLTLVEAALRAGERNLAAALIAERAALRPTSPLPSIQRARLAAGAAERKIAA